MGSVMKKIPKKAKSNGKHPGGRPSKYPTINLKKVEEMAGYGLIEDQIATLLDISPATLKNFKVKGEFLAALKRGKDKADEQVVKSLYQRAIGYDDEKAIYFSSYEGEVTQTPYTKHYAPDVVAQIFWLKNRRKDEWRDRQEHTGPDGGPIEVSGFEVTVVNPKSGGNGHNGNGKSKS
jgi:hypothetical protein